MRTGKRKSRARKNRDLADGTLVSRIVQTYEGVTLADIEELFVGWPGAFENLPSGREFIWSWSFYVDERLRAPGCNDGVDAYVWIGNEWKELDCVGELS